MRSSLLFFLVFFTALPAYAQREVWLEALGKPQNYDFEPTVTSVETFETPEFRAELFLQQNSPDTRQKVLLLKPLDLKPGEKRPGFVVPFYDADRMCGYDLATKNRMPPGREYAEFGRQLVRQGYVVACVEPYPYNLLADPDGTAQKQGLRWWGRAAEKLLTDQPTWTGMGKLTADTRLAIDFLAAQDCVDAKRLGIAGHSLGGKMSFYAGSLDDRISLIWASDFGMRWEDTNWDAPWYWGPEKIASFQKTGLEHSSLLALHPVTFILIAGEADGEQTRPQLERAQKLNPRLEIHLFNHATGHQPTKETVEKSLELIKEKFGVH